MAQTEMNAMPEASDTNPVSDPPAAATPEDEDNALRKRLLSRIAVAGVVILGLLGGLAVFEVLNKPQMPDRPKLATAPIEAPAAAEPAKPIESAEPVAEDKSESVAVEPERTETVMESPRSAKPLTLPATPRTASIKPPPPVVAPAKPNVRGEIAKAMPEGSASVATPPKAHATTPLAQVVEGAKRFLVQVGVFSNHANAEELVTKLHEAGIPAQIESRVQVGPFASRAEVDAARTKLKALGIDEGLLVRR